MAVCTQYFEAWDENEDYPSDVNPGFEIKKWDGSSWVSVGSYSIPDSPFSLLLIEGMRYKVYPTPGPPGWATPSDVEFTACGNDIVLIWERICPDPTVSITSVSNYNPASGETVDFTSYSSGGTGHTIVSRKWDFGDGTSSILANPSKAWTNTTGSSIAYTVKFTATNDCLASKSTSTTVTVASEVVKNGIEIQFPTSLNGKQLIAHGAISTVLDLWWTGPAVHGGLWTKGRVTWDDIDSTKKYHISVGDACKESLPIDDVYPEYPDLCAGTFADGDDVVILVRNPGFDFRVYGSGNVHTLSGTSFGVLYLDAASGDIIDEVLTGKVCGWLGIPSGTECDAFWAEFYDPIFVANYMSIVSTGVDMFGNPKTLTWIDHVAFVASLVGSLPVFNIFPFAGITKQLGEGIIVIARKTADLAGDELAKAGGAMADICVNAPNAIGDLIKSELDEVRAALVKVFGDIQGNKYVDDALAACRTVLDDAYDLVKNADATVDDIKAFDQLLIDNPGLGSELTTKYTDALTAGIPATNEVKAAINNHAVSKHTGDIVEMYTGAVTGVKGVLAEKVHIFKKFENDYDTVNNEFGEIKAHGWVRSWAKTEISILNQPTNVAVDIPDALDEFTHNGHILADDLTEEIRKVPDNFAESPIDEWQAEAKASAKSFSQKCWGAWNAMTSVVKLSNVEKMMVLALSFATAVLYGIYRYTKDDTSEQAITSLSLALFTKSLERFFWPCKNASDEGRWADLEAAIGLYAADIDDAEAALARHETVQKENGTYDDFYECLMMHKFNLGGFRHDLDMATNRGTLRVTSNRNEFYAQLDGTGDPVYSWKTMEVIFHHVPVGSHSAFIMKAGYTDCTTPSGTVTAGEITTVHCNLVEEACVPAVPSITAPSTGVVKEAISFKGSATTESRITWWHWDFGDGDDINVQNPSHMYWHKGTYLVQLTVTDGCGTATTIHTITIEEEAPPPEEESATVYVFMPLDVSKTPPVLLVWQDDPEVYVGGQYERKVPGSIAFGGFGEPEVKGCTLMARATGYQDVSKWFDLKDKDSLTWQPKMYPVDYVPPVDKFPIDFYIPAGAVLSEPVKLPDVPIIISKIVAGMKRIGGR